MLTFYLNVSAVRVITLSRK